MVRTKKGKFVITLTLGGVEGPKYVGKGETASDALADLEKPEKLMAKGILHITDGTKSNTLLMYPPQMKRLFYNKGFLTVLVKSFIMGMK